MSPRVSRRHTPPGAVVRLLPDPSSSPVEPSGPVRSVQMAEFELAPEALAKIWSAPNLERLARAYWGYLRRVSLGLIRVAYEEDSRSVYLGIRRFALLRFRAPRYDIDREFSRVTWPIERGVLVARAGRGLGYLRIDVRRCASGTVRVSAEVSNFYPLLRGSGRFAKAGSWLYTNTQLRLHVWITRGFLRSLASLDLPELRSGRAAAYEPVGPA